MRLLLLLLLALVGLIQYPLWIGRGGWLSVWDMQQQVASQRTINEGLRARNQALSAEVEDLRSGTEAAEERARAELSMMRQGELFVQVLPPDVKAPEVKGNPNPKPSTAAKPASPVAPSATATTPAKPAVQSTPVPGAAAKSVAKPTTPSNSTETAKPLQQQR